MKLRENFRFLSDYTIAAYLMLATTAIGGLNIFLHGTEYILDTIIALLIVALRYLSFVLIKRRFNWSRYLLWLLLVRSVYRLFIVYHLPSAGQLYMATTTLQLLLTLLALYLVYSPLYGRKIKY